MQLDPKLLSRIHFDLCYLSSIIQFNQLPIISWHGEHQHLCNQLTQKIEYNLSVWFPFEKFHEWFTIVRQDKHDSKIWKSQTLRLDISQAIDLSKLTHMLWFPCNWIENFLHELCIHVVVERVSLTINAHIPQDSFSLPTMFTLDNNGFLDAKTNQII